MSYVLHVWEAPVPDSLAGAARTALEMGGDVVGQNPGFIVLAGRLTSRYPCPGVAPATSVWAGAVDGKTERRAWTIGIRAEHERVIRFVVRQAIRLGLCVFDMQQGIAVLPDRRVFGTPGPVMAGARLPAPSGGDSLTRAEVHGGMRRLLQKVFAPFGYLRRDSVDGEAYRLVLPHGFIDIGVAIWEHHSSFSFSLFCSIRHARCVDIVEVFEDVAPEYRGRGACAIIHLDDIHPAGIDRIEVDGLLQFYAELSALEAVLRDHLAPLLAQCQSLEGLERHVNRASRIRSPKHSHVHYMDDIVLAWLVGDPEWERISAECSAALPPRAVELRARIERLSAWLRTTTPAALASARA